MADTMVVAFAGGGDSSPENTAKLLDSELPQELENVYVPDRIVRAQKGLKNVVSWLEQEIGDEGTGYLAKPRKELLALLSHSDADQKWLVYLPPEELTQDDEEFIQEAIDLDITVKNLTEGMDDLILTEKTPPAEPEEPADEVGQRRRGKSRGTSRSAASEEDNEAQGTTETEVKAQYTPASHTDELLDGLYAYFTGRLIADGYLAAPKPVVFPCWCDEDGAYRPRLSRGRGRKGEKPVDLSAADVAAIDGLMEQFEEATAP